MMGCCSVCGKPLSTVNVSGFCRNHAHHWRDDAEKNAAAKAKFSATIRSNPEAVKARARWAGASRLSWCPIEYRDEYRRLRRVKCLPAAQARSVIEGLIAAHARRYRRSGQLQQVTA